MARQSSQKFIARNRAPRVQIEYDVEVYGAEKKVQIPFVMGVLADFFSKPVLDGFIVGLAITIVVGQLDKLLGYEVESLDFVPDVLLILKDIGMTHWPTLVVGLVSLALLFLLEEYVPKIPVPSPSSFCPSRFRLCWTSSRWVSTS